MLTHPGICCLRSDILDWPAETMWRTCTTLTDAEAVFRSLKSELGPRPIFHHEQGRADARLLIPVLACQAVQTLRRPMKAANNHDSRTTVRRTLAALQRATASFRRRDGRTLHDRKTASASPEQAEIHRAMGLAPPPGNLAKTIV